MTAMADEIAEAPDAAARLLQAGPRIDAIAAALRAREIPFVVLCGRGSSGHAGVALRYLIESHLGLIVSASAPSIITSYRIRRRSRARSSSSSRNPAAVPISSRRRGRRGRAAR